MVMVNFVAGAVVVFGNRSEILFGGIFPGNDIAFQREEPGHKEHLFVQGTDEHRTRRGSANTLKVDTQNLTQPETHGSIAQLDKIGAGFLAVVAGQQMLLKTRSDDTAGLLLDDRQNPLGLDIDALLIAKPCHGLVDPLTVALIDLPAAE